MSTIYVQDSNRMEKVGLVDAQETMALIEKYPHPQKVEFSDMTQQQRETIQTLQALQYLDEQLQLNKKDMLEGCDDNIGEEKGDIISNSSSNPALALVIDDEDENNVLLQCHAILMRGLIDNAGAVRKNVALCKNPPHTYPGPFHSQDRAPRHARQVQQRSLPFPRLVRHSRSADFCNEACRVVVL